MSKQMDVKTQSLTDDDAEYVVLCRKGDTDAFGVLVERHQKKMLNIAYRMTGDYEEACDIVQEAFLSAYRAIGNFRGEARFSTWLYGIVLNQAKNSLKQRRARASHEGPFIDNPSQSKEIGLFDESSFLGGSIAEQLEKKELHAKVQECIGTLEEEQREVLVLRDIQGFSYAEISDILNLPDGTVRSRLFRARNAVKDCLKKIIGDFNDL